MAAGAALALALFSCQRAEVEEAPAADVQVAEEADSPAIVPGEMIVELNDDMADTLAGLSPEEAGAMLGVNTAERLFSDGGEFEPRHRKAGLHRWFKLKYDEAEKTVTKASDEVLHIPGVISTEPVRRIKQEAIPAFFNDPSLNKQWHYYNDGTGGGDHKAGCDINVFPVWENFTTGSKNVIVAVVDGGIDLNHEDLKAACIPGGPNGSKNFTTGNVGYTITPHDHGTHVAGTIGAINNNGKGVCGIAGGSDGTGGVKLMSCQIFAVNPDDPTKDIGGNSDDAIVWAADHGAVICNNSWGYVYDSEESASHGGVGSVGAAINYFINNAGCDAQGNQTGPMKGGVVFFSAGNEGWAHGWPAEYDRVVAVGALSPGYTRAYYSNYGDWVDIAAPGGDVNFSNGTIYSTLTSNNYGGYQGTSMACPHVTGVAALLISYFGGPGFTNEMLKERLLGGAKTGVLPKAANIGPMLDAYGSFTYGGTTPPAPVTSYTVSTHSNFIDFEWKVTKDDDDKKAYGYLLLASKNASDFTNLDPKNLPSSVTKLVVEVGSAALGSTLTATMEGLDFSAGYNTAIVGYDYWNNYSSLSPVKQVTTGTNSDPTITTEYEGDFKVKAHQTLNVDYTITDPDGHSFTVNFVGGSAAASNTKISDGVYRLTIAGNAANPGVYTATYTVKDAYNATTVKEIEYTILENQAPVVIKDIDNMFFDVIGSKLAINMEQYIVDPDEEQLTFNVVTSPIGIVHLNQVGNVLNLTTLDYGLASVTITGKDAKGLKATTSFQVRVRDPKAEPDVYPTQVTDFLYISDGDEKEISVTITNSGGKVLFEKTFTADVFNPAAIDMSGYAPGIYGLKVVSDGKTVKRTIVKL